MINMDKGKEDLYHSFYLITELEISANFIWDGVKRLNQIKQFAGQINDQDFTNRDNESMLFSALNYFSIGIERLQKVIISVNLYPNEEISEEDVKLMHSHDLPGLEDRIISLFGTKKNKIEKNFMHVLATFYNNGRYSNYTNQKKYRIIEEFKKFANSQNIDLKNRSQTLERIGRVLGAIVSRYFDLIKKMSSEKNIYLFELNTGTDSFKILNSKIYPNKSLQYLYSCITYCKQEAIFYLLKKSDSACMSERLKLQDELELDYANIPDLIDYLTDNSDTSDFIYEEIGYYDDKLPDLKKSERIEFLANYYKYLDLPEND